MQIHIFIQTSYACKAENTVKRERFRGFPFLLHRPSSANPIGKPSLHGSCDPVVSMCHISGWGKEITYYSFTIAFRAAQKCPAVSSKAILLSWNLVSFVFRCSYETIPAHSVTFAHTLNFLLFLSSNSLKIKRKWPYILKLTWFTVQHHWYAHHTVNGEFQAANLQTILQKWARFS